MPEPIFIKFGTYIMASEHISTAYFINPSHQSVYLYVHPLFQRAVILWKQNFGRETFSNEASVKPRGRLDTLGKWSVKWEVDGTSSGSCPVVGFGIINTKTFSLAARELEN
jgi:hypothetical protein